MVAPLRLIRWTTGAAWLTVPVLLAVACGSPASPTTSSSPHPTTTPIDTTSWSAFSSDRHGYEMRFPSDWIASKATQPWLFGNGGDQPGDATVDQFDAPSPAAALVIASQAIPAGTTEEAWWNDYVATMAHQPPGCAPPREQWATVTISGRQASVHGGFADCNYTEAVLVVERRAYIFTAYADLRGPSGAIFDRKLFDAFLATVSLRPAEADDR